LRRREVEYAIQNAIDAISLGSLYALLALGIALIFGIMQLINFAYGELLMIGGYSLFFLVDIELGIAIVGVIIIVIVSALLMERVAFRPVRGADPSTLLVTSFALSFLLQNVAILAFGSRPKSVPLPAGLSEFFTVGDLRISRLSVLIVVVTAILLVSLALFLKRTTLGIQMRAAAEDFGVTRLLGVRANVVIAAAFGLSGFLAAVAAILLVSQTATVTPTMGVTPVIIAFVATVLGGMGSLPGAVIGGFFVGCLTVALQASLPLNLRLYRDAFVFGAVILVLLLRPQGIVVTRAARTRI
jgi:branched-chain amino acid transport system permease protein